MKDFDRDILPRDALHSRGTGASHSLRTVPRTSSFDIPCSTFDISYSCSFRSNLSVGNPILTAWKGHPTLL